MLETMLVPVFCHRIKSAEVVYQPKEYNGSSFSEPYFYVRVVLTNGGQDVEMDLGAHVVFTTAKLRERALYKYGCVTRVTAEELLDAMCVSVERQS